MPLQLNQLNESSGIFGLNVAGIEAAHPGLIRRIVPMAYDPKEAHWLKIPSRVWAKAHDGRDYIRGKREGDKKYLRGMEGKGYPQRLAEFPENWQGSDVEHELKSEINIMIARSLDWAWGLALGEGCFAIDCDCDDFLISQKVYDAVVSVVGEFPFRWRGGARWATVFLCDATGKGLYDNIKLQNGSEVEFLEKGRGIVVSGFHKSGGKYYWIGGDLSNVLVITGDQLTAIRRAIAGTGEAVEKRKPGRPPKKVIFDPTQNIVLKNWDGDMLRLRTLNNIINYDKTILYFLNRKKVEWLKRQPFVNGFEPGDGDDSDKLYIRCPFEHEHTSPNGEKDCVCFIPREIPCDKEIQLYYKCVHGHCNDREHSEFDRVIFANYKHPIQAALFDWTNVKRQTRDVMIEKEKIKESWNAFQGYQAQPMPLQMALSDYDFCKFRVAWDDFKAARVWSRSMRDGKPVWDEWNDGSIARAESMMNACGFTKLEKGAVENCIRSFEEENHIHSFREYISKRFKEHRPTISAANEAFSHLIEWLNIRPGRDYFRQIDYLWAALKLLFTSLWARATSGAVLDDNFNWIEKDGVIYRPYPGDGSGGVQADNIFIWQGEQGAKKTSLMKVLAIEPEYYTEVSFETKNDDIVRMTRGKIIAELSEKGSQNRKDNNEFKGWVSRATESLIPKYKEYAKTMPRSFVPQITTNDRDIFLDSTGERRKVLFCVGDHIDLDSIRDRILDLWYYASDLYKRNGVMWQDVAEIQKAHKYDITTMDEADEWEERIFGYFAQCLRAGTLPYSSDVYFSLRCLALDGAQAAQRAAQNRVSSIIMRRGWKRASVYGLPINEEKPSKNKENPQVHDVAPGRYVKPSARKKVRVWVPGSADAVAAIDVDPSSVRFTCTGELGEMSGLPAECWQPATTTKDTPAQGVPFDKDIPFEYL